MKKAEKPSKTKAYHHGDLRRAVLTAAWALVRKRGLRELTLREVARRIGVSHAAPYHHFPDLDALIDAMAEQAFTELDQIMGDAKRGIDDPIEQLFRLGCAYVDFARARPERVEVMFRRPASGGGADPKAFEQNSGGFMHLVETLAAAQRAGLAPAGDTLTLALSAWSMVHGLAALWTEGPLDMMPPYQGRYEELRDATVRNCGEWLKAAAKANL